MEDEAPIPSKKGRQSAIAATRRRLDARADKEALWQIINDYDRSKPPVQPEERATALVLGTILEQGLETAILSHCIPMDHQAQKQLFQGGEDGPMNFAVKIRLGHALGVYGDDSKEDLDLLRHVRNLFAHAPEHIMFTDVDVIALCGQIKWLAKYSWGGILGPKPTPPIKKYIESVRYYYSYFITQAKNGPISYKSYQFPDMYS